MIQNMSQGDEDKVRGSSCVELKLIYGCEQSLHEGLEKGIGLVIRLAG